MKLGKILTSIAAASLVAAPSIAQAGIKAAAPTGGTPVRSSLAVKGDNKLVGAPLFLAFLGAVAVAATVVIVADNDNKSDGAQ